MAKEYSEKSWADFLAAGGNGSMSFETEWAMWLGENGYEFFGDIDCWPNGKTLALRCRAHLIGLKMAVEQVKEQLQ